MSMPARALLWISAVLSLNAAAQGVDDDFPDLELLEFIVEWRSDGDALDPDVFVEDEDAAGLADEAGFHEAR